MRKRERDSVRACVCVCESVSVRVCDAKVSDWCMYINAILWLKDDSQDNLIYLSFNFNMDVWVWGIAGSSWYVKWRFWCVKTWNRPKLTWNRDWQCLSWSWNSLYCTWICETCYFQLWNRDVDTIFSWFLFRGLYLEYMILNREIEKTAMLWRENVTWTPILNTSANLAWAIFEKSKCLDYFQNIVFCWSVGWWFWNWNIVT